MKKINWNRVEKMSEELKQLSNSEINQWFNIKKHPSKIKSNLSDSLIDAFKKVYSKND